MRDTTPVVLPGCARPPPPADRFSRDGRQMEVLRTPLGAPASRDRTCASLCHRTCACQGRPPRLFCRCSRHLPPRTAAVHTRSLSRLALARSGGSLLGHGEERGAAPLAWRGGSLVRGCGDLREGVIAKVSRLVRGRRAGFCKMTSPLSVAFGSRSCVRDRSLHSLH
jgi:hypothetical protein